MNKTISVEIVTPEKQALSAPAVDSVVLPAADGEYGVLPNHAPALIGLSAGTVRLHTGSETQVFAIGGGYAEVQRDKVSVFAEAAELPEEIDAERARQALEKAKADLLRKDLDPMTLMQAEAAARRAAVRLKVAELKDLRHRKSTPTR